MLKGFYYVFISYCYIEFDLEVRALSKASFIFILIMCNLEGTYVKCIRPSFHLHF